MAPSADRRDPGVRWRVLPRASPTGVLLLGIALCLVGVDLHAFLADHSRETRIEVVAGDAPGLPSHLEEAEAIAHAGCVACAAGSVQRLAMPRTVALGPSILCAFRSGREAPAPTSRPSTSRRARAPPRS